MELPEIADRCRLACGAEAEVMGFPAQAGYDIYEGYSWVKSKTSDQIIDWVIEMQCLYNKVNRTGYQLIALYKRCNEIMGEYAQLV